MATLVGIIASMWPSITVGADKLDPLAINQLAEALRWPAVVLALLVTLVTMGADHDSGVEDELALAGINPWPVRGADSLASIIITVGAFGGALGAALLVRWGSWLRAPDQLLWPRSPLAPLLATLAALVVGSLLAGLLAFACARSARRALAVLVALTLTFGLILSIKHVLPSLFTAAHPFSGPWRLVYKGQSARLTLPFSRGVAVMTTAFWLVMLGIAAAVGLRPRR